MPAAAACALRLDPFAPEYDAAIQLGETAAPLATVDATVESAAWQAVSPKRAPSPERVFFVDGVRRIEHRLFVETAEASLFGLLASYGVGATRLTGRSARVVGERIERVLVVGGGERVEALEVSVPRGRAVLRFEARVVPDNTPLAPIDGLQRSMRESEARLSQELGPTADLVFLDGPLSYLTTAAGPVVGFVKRLMGTYLQPAAASLLPRLGAGERTPLFLIQDRVPRYSWYLRLAHGRSIESALAGVVRLETSAELGLRDVQTLADASCRLLPRLASDSAHDPRAPANLYPIGGLESRLRRLLGDSQIVRRAIELRLHQDVPA
ncbi:MAG TPA: hypothetical protein VMV21_04490 [Vicinamibacteria bacterium]|nr:hypothetical protein [Vicinamibacteria bacterium]